MSNLSFNKKFFKKKRRQKYPRNAFFSYHAKNRNEKNFNFKDFRNSNSVHSTFIKSSFYGTYFNKSTLKYCCFNGAKFQSITFINCNFRGSKFKGSYFKNCLFKNCRFEKTDFRNAKFENCFVKGSKFKGAKNLPKNFIPQKVPPLKDKNIIEEMKQRYNKSVILKLISTSNVNRLLEAYSKREITTGLDKLAEQNLKDITFSHMTIFIERAKY